ncbi:MAG: histidine phosphatase family protein [Chloroflexi bacterium]|nr:histidine phosphatase family protein [Chloroflexota bacterium]
MLTLYLVRHGETQYNADGRFQGVTDVPLNELGRKQAAAVGERFKSMNFDVIYSSDLQRAQETAKAISAHHQKEIILDQRLREIDFGSWEGLFFREVFVSQREVWERWRAEFDFAPERAETLQTTVDKADSMLAHIREHHEDQTVVCVGHGGTLRVMVCRLLGIPPQNRWQLQFDNTSVSEVWFREGIPFLRHLNDVAHLNGLNEA